MRRIIVPDATILGAAFFNEDYSDKAIQIVDAIKDLSVDAIAPSCVHYEFLNICRKKYNNGKNPISLEELDATINEFLALPIVVFETTDFTNDAWQCHTNTQLSPFDYFYVRIGKEWNAEIWSLDGGLVENGRKTYLTIHDARIQSF